MGRPDQGKPETGFIFVHQWLSARSNRETDRADTQPQSWVRFVPQYPLHQLIHNQVQLIKHITFLFLRQDMEAFLSFWNQGGIFILENFLPHGPHIDKSRGVSHARVENNGIYSWLSTLLSTPEFSHAKSRLQQNISFNLGVPRDTNRLKQAIISYL